ncbi:GGDEF domain-containing protein [Parerythrobacter jejuensis]|uniref:diguanylate cyclase n=1 Tax=Parerythrobacter jejuensis TaxID=795812 RepID=A0A845AU50_9SPHN|nr:diguanylate cyclase [Parerythrobacter jejuensis]MXP32693.1 diguanylate cyclase [Parerythrobacter jejuensis]
MPVPSLFGEPPIGPRFNLAPNLWKKRRYSGPHRRAIRAEVLAAMVDREAQVAPAHLIALGLLLASLAVVTQPGLLALALCLRTASLLLTRRTTARLVSDIDLEAGEDGALNGLYIAMTLAGVSWATLLLALDPAADPPIAVALVAGVVMIGVSLVIITYGPIASVKVAYVASFLGTLAVACMTGHPVVPWQLMLGVAGLVAGPVLFSRGAARHSITRACLTVENRRLSDKLQQALERAERLAHHDPMTDLLNRRAFFQRFSAPPDAGTERHLLMIDLDHFKAINDCFGHDAGDMVLCGLAREMEAVLAGLPAGNHGCVRLGGEEFVFVLDRLDLEEAHAVAEDLRKRARLVPVRQGMSPNLGVSASIGVAVQKPGESLDDVLRRSDLAMYRAKDRGRNQVALAA